MRCPHCASVVEPLRDTAGALFCPACQNSGVVSAPWPPPGPAAAPMPLPAAPTTPSQPAAGASPKAPGKAVAALVLGIAALVLFPLALILGPIALVYGVKANGEVKRSPPGTPGQGMAIAGMVLGGIAILVGITVVFAAVVFVLVSNLAEGGAGGPTFAFEVDSAGAGGTLTLADFTGQAHWSDYELGGTARCTLPSGDVEEGDRIVCVTDGDVVLIDWATEETVYFATV